MNNPSNGPQRYDDIIGLARPLLKKHPPMSIQNRAAQFAPFAALVGYDASIKETARLTGRRIELDDDEKLLISGKLQLIQEHIGEQPEVTVTFFQPDRRKDGGAYVDAAGAVKKVDAHERIIVMANGKSIPVDEVIAIDGDLFKGMDAYLAGWSGPGF